MSTRRSLLKASVAATAGAAGGLLSAADLDAAELQEAAGPITLDKGIGGHYDVAVVGAGAAGFTAARTLMKNGLRVIVLEARGRTGGRTHSDTRSFGAGAFDYGAQWFQPASSHPLLFVAMDRGFPVVKDEHRFLGYHNRQPVSAEQNAAYDNLRTTAMGAALLAGANAAFGGPDVSIADATATLAGDPLYRLALAYGEVALGKTADLLSCEDLFAELATAASPVEYLIRSGMGDFVHRVLGNGIPVNVSTPVTEIKQVPGGLSLVTPRGTVTAKRCVLTAPMGVLAPQGVVANSKIKFTPGLPDAYQEAIAGLPMGNDEKIGLGFNSMVFPRDLPINSTLIPFDPESPLRAFFLAPFWRRDFCVCILGADLARSLANQGKQAMIDFALDTLATMFPIDFRRHLRVARASNWTTDPWSLGSYSFALPGHAEARAVLNIPVPDAQGVNRLFFAGEAVAVNYHSSVLGAFLTGFQAAIQVLAET